MIAQRGSLLDATRKVVSLGLIVFGLSVAAGAAAQTPPEGNAHPHTSILSGAAGGNPFADTGAAPVAAMDVKAKTEFAARLRANGALEPLRDLAVFHRGRVKILDTLGRETVRTITGRKDYIDFLPTSEGRAKKVHSDPLFTLLDLSISPEYYSDKALIHVEYLPLREKLLEQAYKDPQQQEWWKIQGRLAPAVIEAAGRALIGQLSQEQFQRGFNSIMEAMSLYREGWQNFVMVAPDSAEKPWRHVSELSSDAAPGKDLRDLAAAWRAGDAEKVKSAAAAFAADIKSINPSMYPESKRRLEMAYNAANPFEWGYWLYLVALLSLLLAFGTGRRWLAGVGIATLVGAVALHAFGFGARCVIAERFAIQNQFESMTGLSLFATVVGLSIMLLRRQWLFGAAAAGVGFMVLVTATQTNIPGVSIEREAAILNTSVLLKYHVTTVLVSYGLIALGFITSLFYLGTHYAARLRAAPGIVGMASMPGGAALAGAGGGMVDVSAAALGLNDESPKGPKRVLADLDRAQMIILQLAFWTLGVGILLGAWWADHSWGRWWAFDPKETWALITWLVYLVVIHIRVTNIGSRALVTAWLSVLGFFVMLFTYFGVNLVLPGLHAYA